jgi:hypothetical protein
VKMLTAAGLDNTRYSHFPTTHYTHLSRSPRLLDPILLQGIGIWSCEDPRLAPFPGAKPRLFRSPPDLPNIDHGRHHTHSHTAAGKRQPLHSRDPWAFSPWTSTALLV